MKSARVSGLPRSPSTEVVLIPAIPQGTICLNPEVLSLRTLIAIPCIEHQRDSLTPIEAILCVGEIQTPALPSMRCPVKEKLSRVNSKLTDNEVLLIYDLIMSGERYKIISERFNISQSQITSIKQKKTYKWLWN